MSGLIGFFTFGFLHSMCYAMILKIGDGVYYTDGFMIDYDLLNLIESICFVGAIIVFFAFFLFFIGQKFSYILEINQAIEQLEGGNLAYRVVVQGNNEISDLAYSLNNMAETLEHHIANEGKLKKEYMELVQSLSHDIRTPLTTIISYTDFIKDRKYDNLEKLESYADIIQNKAYQIKGLTQLLLEDHLNTSIPYEKELFEGKMLMQQLLGEYEELLEDEGFSVVIHFEGLPNFKTRLNPQDMVRILDNLTSNIIKYADQAEKIVFKLSLEQDILTLLQSNRTKLHNNHVESFGIGIKSIHQLARYYNGHVKTSQSNADFNIEIKLHI